MQLPKPLPNALCLKGRHHGREAMGSPTHFDQAHGSYGTVAIYQVGSEIYWLIYWLGDYFDARWEFISFSFFNIVFISLLIMSLL